MARRSDSSPVTDRAEDLLDLREEGRAVVVGWDDELRSDSRLLILICWVVTAATPMARALKVRKWTFKKVEIPDAAGRTGKEVAIEEASEAGAGLTAFEGRALARSAEVVVMPRLDRMARSFSRARVVRMRAASSLIPSFRAICGWVWLS